MIPSRGGAARMQREKTEYLVQKAKAREPEAFTELMQLHMKDMYRTALAILMNDEDAADAIQDTILACWEKIDGLRQAQYFRTWMTRILINKCYDMQRKRAGTVGLDECEEPAREDDSTLALREALEELDEKYRIVLVLFYSEGYHGDEIARMLNIPKSTVQTRLQRGREKLAQKYYDES